MTKTMYVIAEQKRAGVFYYLRQERFRGMNPEHPHDVCAVARNPQEMRGMTEGDGHWVGEIDWSEVGGVPSI